MVGLLMVRVPSDPTLTLLLEAGSKRVPFKYQSRVVPDGPELAQVSERGDRAETTTGDELALIILGLAGEKNIGLSPF